MLDVRLCGCDCCTFTIKIVSFGIFALMDFLFILFLFFFLHFVLSNDCLKLRLWLKLGLGMLKMPRHTDTHISVYRYRYRYIYRCEMRNAHTLHWIEVERKMNWLRYKVAARYLALSCSVPVQAILLARSMVRGPWSIHGPLCIALLLSLLQFFFFSFFFLSSFLLFPSALECFKLSWA